MGRNKENIKTFQGIKMKATERLAYWIDREEKMMATLKKIADPIYAMQTEANKYGAKLDGNVAVALTKDASYLRGLAQTTLNELED